MPAPIRYTEQVMLATLMSVLMQMGWRWCEVYRYCGISNVYGLRLRALFGIAPIRPWGSYRRSGEWQSDEDFDAWFMLNDPASPFRRQAC